MTNRHRAREVALQILYRYDTAAQQGTPVPQGLALADELTRHFDHFKVPENLRLFSSELVAGTLSKIGELDQLLEKYAKNWKVARMSSIDRSLLRMAAYELANFPDIPASVTIDEAVELGKQFGTAETAGFVNGILDAIRLQESPEEG